MTISEILDATQGELIKGSRAHLVSNICIDSRLVKKDDCFIAIHGKTLNGHNFGYQAIEHGASTIIAHQLMEMLMPAENLIKVKDTTRTLGDIAKYYRRKFSPQVIAVSGSNGKTTTKEMISHLIKEQYQTVKAPNSFNNDIGVPLTVLQIDNNTQVLVLEMEMNQIGGIRRLCDIALPKIGILTNIGDTHLEFLYDRDGVAREKSELLESIDKFGTAILNQDDCIVMEIGNKYQYQNKITYGIKNQSDFYATDIENFGEFGILFKLNSKYPVRLNIPGLHNIYNALAAISTARYLNLELDTIIGTLETFKLNSMRMEKIIINDIEIHNDAFNANPQSMLTAIETFMQFKSSGRKVLILGDMLELGKKSEELHENIGHHIPANIDVLITIGKQAEYIAKSAKYNANIKMIETFVDVQEAAHKLVDIIKNKDKILIKGSRAVKLELIIKRLKELYDSKT